MNKTYRTSEWNLFRIDVIQFYNGICDQCGRSESEDDITLQVHHTKYINGRKPWEYSFKECQLLCKGCHAREHGIIRPNTGWTYIATDDLGLPEGICDLCQKSIRFVYLIHHPHWQPMQVGCDCSDRLTETPEASHAQKEWERFQRFCNSSLWKNTGNRYSRRYKNFSISIRHQEMENLFQTSINGTRGKLYKSILEAKKSLYNFFEKNGHLIYFDQNNMYIPAERRAKKRTVYQK